MAESFTSTSNPSILKGVVTVYEDSSLKHTMVAVGYGEGIYGEQIVRWTSTSVAANTVDYDVGEWTFLLLMITFLSLIAEMT